MSCVLGVAVSLHLSDDDLWLAIVQNTNAVSALIERQADLEAGNGAIKDPDNPAHRMLVQDNRLKLDRFAREYADYTAELRRRYP